MNDIHMTVPQRDKKIVWHPFTQEKTAMDTIAVKYAKGSYIYDENNKAYLDLISSWWVNLHGHADPKIAQSIYEQALKLEHVIFAGFTHEPAVKLCEELSKILPPELKRFFFSDNGSTAVEVALKMAYQYWFNKNKKEKVIFLSFEGGYHGDTFGAMSVGNKSGFHDIFSNLFFRVLSIPYPATWDNDEERDLKEEAALTHLSEHLAKFGNKIAAIILEPLVQGASGMQVVRAEFIRIVLKMIKEHDILVIFDEVMTGFCRTGSYFALSQINAIPDFICLSKGITGGFLPLALTVTTESVYNAFLSNKWSYAFAHGHSYTANPLACAAAITSLNMLVSPECQSNIASINKAHLSGISFLKEECTNIKNTRVIGTISAFTMKNINDFSIQLQSKFLQRGLLIRPLKNNVYLLPPYSTSADEIEYAYKKIARILCENDFF